MLDSRTPRTAVRCQDASLMARLGWFARAPLTAAARGIDNMKMTALSAWAVNELGHAGADQVELSWEFGNPDVEISASFFGQPKFSAKSDGDCKRDRAVMSAVSKILDDRIEFMNFSRRGWSGGGSSEAWWEVLGVTPDADRGAVDKAYKALARQVHPDIAGPQAGSDEMARINVAREQALFAVA